MIFISGKAENKMIHGFRIGGTYILEGYGMPVSAVTQLSLQTGYGLSDTVMVQGSRNNVGVDIQGFRKTSVMDINLRVGYEILPDQYEFFVLYGGFQIGARTLKYKFTYDADEFDGFEFYSQDEEMEDGKVSKTIMQYGGHIGAMYELPAFRVFAEFDASLGFGALEVDAVQSDNSFFINTLGLSVGIFVPIINK